MRISDWSSDVCSSDLAGLSLSHGGRAADQFPPAAIDAFHAGVRHDGAGPDAGGLCPCHCSGIPLLFLWGCKPVVARAGRGMRMKMPKLGMLILAGCVALTTFAAPAVARKEKPAVDPVCDPLTQSIRRNTSAAGLLIGGFDGDRDPATQPTSVRHGTSG